jgi:hypothetical protein
MVRTDAQQHVVPDDVGLPRSARVVLLDRQIEENIPGNLRAQPLDARIEAPVESDPWMRAQYRDSRRLFEVGSGGLFDEGWQASLCRQTSVVEMSSGGSREHDGVNSASCEKVQR